MQTAEESFARVQAVREYAKLSRAILNLNLEVIDYEGHKVAPEFPTGKDCFEFGIPPEVLQTEIVRMRAWLNVHPHIAVPCQSCGATADYLLDLLSVGA